MRTVKNVDQLNNLRTEKPAPLPVLPPADNTLALAVKAASTEQAEILKQVLKVLQQPHPKPEAVPVKVSVQESARPKKWKFEMEYDSKDKLVSITAEAQE